MKALTTIPALFLAAMVGAAGAFAQAPAPKGPTISPPPLSLSSTLKQRVGFTDVEIVYQRPSLRGRKAIFGVWEPWGEVWRTGADRATKITFSTPVRFGGKELAAGTYALYSIPGEREWTIIFNTASGDWGAYTYKKENDVLRVTARPVTLSAPVETFTIDINDLRTESATLNLAWEKVRVSVPFEFDVISKVNEQIEAALKSGQPLSAGTYFQAALFQIENNLDLHKAKEWIGEAVKKDPRFFYLYHQARILAKLGDKAGAEASARQSLAAAEKQGGTVAAEYRRRNEELLATLK